jgi:Uma2 family endonuclease
MTAATLPPKEWRLAEPGAGPLTVDDWFTREDFPERCEIFQGMLLMAPPPGGSHQALTTNLTTAFGLYSHASGGVALTAPTGVVLAPTIGFEPDVLYLTPERAHYLRRRGVEGPPDIVVEVLSRSTRVYDLETKLPTYLAHGVREVWIVDPIAKTVAVYEPQGEPRVCRFGEPIPSRIVDVGTAWLESLPEIGD